MALEQALSADEQAQMDAMRAADAQPGSVEPAAPEAPSAEPSPGEGGAAAPAEQQQQRMVPHQALHEERERRKKAEQDASEERRRWEDRFNQLLQRVPQPQQDKPADTTAIPDVAADPVGHILGKIGATEQKAAEAVAQQQQIAQAFQAQQIETGLRSWAMGQEAAFKAENPQYEKAVEFIKSMEDLRLQALGVADAGVRAQRLSRSQLEIAAHAYQENMNPADIIMKMAVASGFKPEATPAATEAVPAISAAEERIGNVQAGQQQARSLGNARGTAPAGLTAARILEMSDADFSKAMQTPEGIALLGS